MDWVTSSVRVCLSVPFLIQQQWLVLSLYGLAGSLFAYLGSIVTSSALAAFALVAGYQVIMFIVSAPLGQILLVDPASALFGGISLDLNIRKNEQSERYHHYNPYANFTSLC
jgi:hypothetical protein